MMTNAEIEQEIRSKGLIAPRITADHISAVVVKEQYHVFDGTSHTVCCLTLTNGFTVTGESSVVNQQNFSPELGRQIARTHAVEKIWALEGYLLKQRLFERQARA